MLLHEENRTKFEVVCVHAKSKSLHTLQEYIGHLLVYHTDSHLFHGAAKVQLT